MTSLAISDADFKNYLLKGVYGNEASLMRVNYGEKTKKFEEEFLTGAKGKELPIISIGGLDNTAFGEFHSTVTMYSGKSFFIPFQCMLFL
jgi:hypothetical protein